jgi:alpha-glutamyl/putrescinyl thymine pyrophosphorylase-like protein
VRPRDRELAQWLDAGLRAFDRTKRHLPGIRDEERRGVFIEQLLESVHRVNFVKVIRARQLSLDRGDPSSELFNPLKAAILHQRTGNVDEAFWMVFLFVHFGKHSQAGWRYAREIYGRLGEGGRWDWARTSADPNGFRAWLHAHLDALKREGVPRGFGNHRKYESLDAHSPNGTGAAVETYINWVKPPRTHQELVANALEQSENDPKRAFDILYQSMEAVSRFGRTARFDYLTMLGKLGLAAIEPGSTYMRGATGPLKGAQLLFGGRGQHDLESWLADLDVELKVGMQVLEDALCNWQKSPKKFKPFRA